ncbi:hypothetical protein [Alteromonas facilis]|uniref:hypothetical protein n=1 Tax=Alteromonas facilis TaxID=2048004 RepID=UPI000C2848F6|nr:hypothetical protein [Alteromonas facilis]
MNKAKTFLSNETTAMAKHAIEILRVDERYSLSLLLNNSPNLSNQAAVGYWITDYIKSNPDNADFHTGVLPSLRRELFKYENREW